MGDLERCRLEQEANLAVNKAWLYGLCTGLIIGFLATGFALSLASGA